MPSNTSGSVKTLCLKGQSIHLQTGMAMALRNTVRGQKGPHASHMHKCQRFYSLGYPMPVDTSACAWPPLSTLFTPNLSSFFFYTICQQEGKLLLYEVWYQNSGSHYKLPTCLPHIQFPYEASSLTHCAWLA